MAPELLVTVLDVDEVPAGAYAYEESSGELRLWQQGRHGAALARALYLANANGDSASFVVHLAATADWRKMPWGARWYRIQQMLVGIALDAAMLASSSGAVTAHAFLGFDAARIAEIYGLPPIRRVMPQLVVGACRRRRGSTIAVCA